VNGGHLVRIVGPGFDIVRQWGEDGIPLNVVFRGIDSARGASSRRTREAARCGLEFCEADVREVFDGWRRAVGLKAAGAAGAEVTDADAEPRRRSLSRHLDRAIDRLGVIGGRLDLPEVFRDAASRLLKDVIAVREASKKARGTAREELIARLRVLDIDLVAAARGSASPDEIAALHREAEQDLAPYRDRLAGDAWQRSVDVIVGRLLRDRFGLPTLECSFWGFRGSGFQVPRSGAGSGSDPEVGIGHRELGNRNAER
jgi:hypothetical protein